MEDFGGRRSERLRVGQALLSTLGLPARNGGAGLMISLVHLPITQPTFIWHHATSQ